VLSGSQASAGDEGVTLPGEFHLADECARTGEVVLDVDTGLLGERRSDLVHRLLEACAGVDEYRCIGRTGGGVVAGGRRLLGCASRRAEEAGEG